ncbi:MAG: acyltransferase [Parasphingorhabdus sp.]|uniref:acyltransferase family protein n=1 Tax=Parasphingorhabdus sp. TaxID=2709688 RepID=UPI0030010CAA
MPRDKSTQAADVFRHCPEIDSLRAIAMIAVVAMHSNLLPFGWAGVWLFFVISGYVVTLSIIKQHDPKLARPLIKAFYLRRIARIVPVYYIYVILGIFICVAIGVPLQVEALFSIFGFYQNTAIAYGFGEMEFWSTGHLWSISVEMQFYLIYGIAAYFLSLHATTRLLWSFVFVAPLLRLIASAATANWDPLHSAYFIYSGAGLHFDSFAMGGLLALARMKTPINELVGPLVKIGFGAMACYLVIYIGVSILIRDRGGIEIFRDIISGILYGEGREIFLYSALGAFSLAILVLTVARHKVIFWLVRLRLLQWIGSISYGAYIVHAICLQIMWWIVIDHWGVTEQATIVDKLLVFAGGLGMTLIIAQISYLFLERPVMDFLKSYRSEKGLKSAITGEPNVGSS